ncbi:MAG: hypothetical protein A3A98_02050 [Candidatus Staskawiczbacteria bacterium RIFCSPLOWO2_01_FULL_40_39]|uniref:Carbohydrate kinase PfkB domain-containing protein n=1 Tax=Candidatus Staskawiczbacteria bacterium RIFCSPHIGHO2_01_FULL_39_25 TaxID=1802202 RepID=A0A1G2HR86_9BACT|nr:MAG: hypothetical protein A2730_02205 [Candidatus Staskawiczbacteria bacterium RIFCSPHIGHO2_01_FULL_39_25]OGZ72749.1 MAG: hypothetical protein A3A98_02050 [Candidatus Staskawiczbacteria bacterium RIFCSPLOWO2_01_FULL_40_39]
MYDIITFGSAAKDIFVKPKKLTVLKYDKDFSTNEGICFPLGSKIDVEEIQFNTGGGGTNAAATFSKQGFKTAFCGAIGTDLAGQDIINELKALKVDARFVVKKREKLTNHSVIILNEGQDTTILAYRGAAELLDKKDIPWKKLKTKWIYLAPLSGLLCDSFEEIVNFAQQNKIKIAANPGMAQLALEHFPEIAKKIDVLILNREEASFLTKISYEQEKEIFKKLDEMCPGIAVMTKGGDGVVVSDGKNIYSARPLKDRKIVDTTGAGDSFASGFISDFIRENGNIEKAIQFGLANSAGCLSQIGAKGGLLKKGDIFEKIQVVKEECDNNVCIVK